MRVQPVFLPQKDGRRAIGPNEPCFIIAEMSANHGQDFDRAAAIVRAAAASGADAIKIQSYLPETMTIDARTSPFVVGGEKTPDAWKEKTFFDLYKEAHTPREWHAPLKALAEECGLIFLPTPYSREDAEFLEPFHPAAYKIASYEATDIPFLEYVARSGRPIILSVGFATLPEIERSVTALKRAGARELVLLHCVTSYGDAPREEATNLACMRDLSDRFHVPAGFSDNNGGTEAAILAACMGAAVIEKHITLSEGTGLDARFSIDPAQFQDMVAAIRRHERMKGLPRYGPQTREEEYNRRFRRSLFAVEDIREGEPLTPKNVRSIRPGAGLDPGDYPRVLGATARGYIERGTPLSWELIDGEKKHPSI